MLSLFLQHGIHCNNMPPGKYDLGIKCYHFYYGMTCIVTLSRQVNVIWELSAITFSCYMAFVEFITLCHQVNMLWELNTTFYLSKFVLIIFGQKVLRIVRNCTCEMFHIKIIQLFFALSLLLLFWHSLALQSKLYWRGRLGGVGGGHT